MEKVPQTNLESETNPEEILSQETIEILKEGADFKEQTDEIESEIETGTIRQSIFDTIKSLSENTHLKALLAGVLLFTSPYEADAGKPKKAEKTMSAEAIETLKEETGMTVAEIEKIGFHAEVQVPSETGDYLIHIGQVHESQHSLEKNAEKHVNSVVHIQKNIESLLLNLKKRKKLNSPVYSEAFIEDDTYLELLSDMRDEAKKISNGNTTLPEFIRQFRAKFKANSSTEIALSYVYNQAVENNEDKKISAYFDDEFEGTANIYFDLGGATKAFLDNKIILKGAERQKESDDAMAKVKKLLKASKNLAQLKIKFENSKDDTEREMIMRVISTLTYNEMNAKSTDEYDETVHTKREKVAVDIIGRTHETGVDHIIVYGVGHQFKKAIDEHNEANPDTKMGLIKFSPNEE